MKKKLRLLIFLVIAAFLCTTVHAQIPTTKDAAPENRDPYSTRLCQSHFVNLPVRSTDIIAGVQTQLKVLNHQLESRLVGFQLQYDKKSPGGRHFTFEQTYSGFPVFHSQIKVNLNHQNRIKSVFDNSWNVSKWDQAALKSEVENLNLNATETHFKNLHSKDKTDVRSRIVLAVLNGEPRAVAEIELWDNESNEHILVLTDNSFEVYLRRDLNCYHTFETASGLVFNPDPLTTAHVEYGTPYVDDSNRDVTALNNQRIAVDLDVTLDNGVYRLENAYALIFEYSSPDIQPATSNSPVFEYTRSQPGFEDVNVFYHLTAYQQYVESLGFTDLSSVQVQADAHALNGADQSMFTQHMLGPRLFFGEGGVDDAEDADVIVHENGHALSYKASPGTNNGQERQAVDEGIGDYLAASYSRALDTFRWTEVFSWDGHNEFWNGRTVATDRTYSDYQAGGSIHINGGIYSSAITKILVELGRETTDKLLLQSLYGLASNMSMKDAAMLLYDADTVLYGGANFCVIYNALLEKELTDIFSTQACNIIDTAIAAKAGDDKTICAGDSIAIGDPASFKTEYTYTWTPADGLGTPLSLVTNASPRQTTTYILTASRFSGAYNLDTVTVNVLQCDIKLLNTEGFKYGADLIITLPYNSDDNSIEVFDLLGKRMFHATGLNEQSYTLSGGLLPAGGYVIRVKAENATQEQKIVKIR